MVASILSTTKKYLITTIFLVVKLTLTFAQTGPGGIGTSSTNVLWLRADQGLPPLIANGDPVSAWNDISGNANHSAQATGANQPLYISAGINGLPTIRFDGNDYLTVPDADNLDNTNGVSIFVVAKPDVVSNPAKGLVSKRVDSSTERAYSLFIGENSNSYIIFDAGNNRIRGSSSYTTDPQIFSAVYNGTLGSNQSKIFSNGTLYTQGTGPLSLGNYSSNLLIGILNPGYAQGLAGDISEVIVYRSSLNFAERSIVEAYLGNRYNISLGNTSYSSTTFNQDIVGIGFSEGDKLSNTPNVGSGILLSERNNTLDEANEFVFAGHDGTVHGHNISDLPTIPGVNLDQRWDRIYYIERVQGGTIDDGTTDIQIIFDFNEAGLSLSTDKVYYILYRSGTSGSFSEVPGGTGAGSDGKVSINLSSANFASGYYTIARSDQEIKTWYVLNDGFWDDYNTWSLKPTEPDNPSNHIPGVMDRVVVQNNKAVTVRFDNTQSGILDVIDGTVDFGITTGNTFSSITGQSNGKIRLAADNFPSGDASGFASASTGGTVIYYGAGYDIGVTRTFRNMVVDLDNAANQLILLTNYTLNGSLTISNGELHFGNTSTTARTLTVYEHVEVGVNGKIRTGTGITRHQLNLYGDFTNYGNVQFTTRAAVNYTVDNADGIVDVNFRSATRNQNMTLEGPTRFYRIAIEKGTTNTYELYMEATDAAYFSLFGYAAQGHPDQAQLAINNNAFGLAYGTVRVGPNITIDRLNQGGNYNVSENAVLWVDGGSVTKPSGTGEAVVVYGKIKTSAGTFTSNAPSGITSRLNGVFESTGGTTVISQFRTSVYGTQHIGGYIQTGGNVTVNGTAANTNYYSFTLSYEGNVFTLTGGTMTVNGTNSLGAIFINSDPVNVNVSASATMNLIATNTTPFRITTKAPLPTVTLSRSGAAGNRSFILVGGTVGTDASNQAELPALPLVTKGSFTINNDITFDPRGEDVTIGRSYTIGSNASYNAFSNTTTFSGATSNYSILINATATTKYFHNLAFNNSGYTGTLSTSDITIGNNLTITAGTFGTGDRTVTVRGDITNSGTITSTTGKVLITQRGRVHTVNLTNGGSYESVPTVSFSGGTATAIAIFNGTPAAGNALPISKIVITNTGSGYIAAPTVSISGGGGATATALIGTTHELGGNGNGVFGNLEIDEVHPSEAAGKVDVTYLTAKQTVSGTFTLTNGILDLITNNLTILGSLSTEDRANYSVTKMIRSGGVHSDGGLTRRISDNIPYLYPFGVYTSTGNGNRYTPAVQTFSSVIDEGLVTINPVDYELPTLAPSAQSALRYYWRVRANDFDNTPLVFNDFYFYNIPNTYIGGVTPPAAWVIGKIVNLIRVEKPGNRSWSNPTRLLGLHFTHQSANESGASPPTLETGEFTAGHNTRFQGTVKVFFSRLRGTSAAQRLWGEVASWTTLAQVATRFGLTPQQVMDQPNLWHLSDNPQSNAGTPTTGDKVVIGWVPWDDPVVAYRGDPHNIRNNGGTINCAELIFNPMKTASGDPAPRQYWDTYFFRPTITLTGGTTLVTPIISGEGTIRNRDQDTDFSSIDLGDFVAQDSSYMLYEIFGNVTLNNISEVHPNLMIAPDGWGANDRAAIIPKSITVNNNLEVHGAARLRLNTGADGDLYIKGDLRLLRATREATTYTNTRFEFQNSGTSRTVTIEGDIYTEGTVGLYVLTPGTTPIQHTLNLYGSYIQNATASVLGAGQPIFRLWTATDQDRVLLNLFGSTDALLSGTNTTTTATLYNLQVDKGTSTSTLATINIPFTLNGPTNGLSEEKALQLKNGKLILNNSGININLSTGGGDFYIPSTSGLVVQTGTVNVSGANNGILLDGLLRVEAGGTINMDGGAGVNNYIEYSSSGNATIEVTGGTFTVGSQIRRGTSNPAGVLRYTQTAGNVIVGKNAAPVANRGMFEVLNTGSRFIYTGGTLTIVRPQTAATEATVLLEPAVGSAGNTTLQLGNADTPAASIITLKSTIALGNVIVDGESTTARLKDRDLTVNRDLTIGAGCSFDGTGSFSLTVNRHLVNSGSANLNVDTLFLTGSSTFPSAAMQNITGNVRVNHLVVEPEASVTLQPASSLEIDGNLFLNSGQLVDGANTITVKGDVTNNASHASADPNNGGLVFGGSALQRIYGTGQFGRIEVDNANGVQLENSISLNNHLTITNGILQLQSNKLTLGLNANIFGGPFDDNKMIAVGGGDFLQGIQKTFPTVLPGAVPTDPYNEADPAYTDGYSFTFPIGIDNGSVKKYTPVEFFVASNATQGSVNLYPVNRKHITFDDTQTDVLQYYWIMNSSGLSNFTTLIKTHYKDADVVGDESAYIGARLFDNFWAKYEEDAGPPVIEVVYENDDYIAFVYDGADQVTGEYTAGIEPHIPDQVPIFYSKQDGEWTDPNTWEREDGGVVPANGPSGQRVHIRTAHTVTVSSNFRRAYRTTINGRLELGTTINHILGYVSGTGTLSIERSSLPAGDYSAFFACGTGGTMEWAGGTYGLPSSITSYNNLTITGTGTKTFPNVNMTICGDLRIEGSVTLKQAGTGSGYYDIRILGSAYILNTSVWDMNTRVRIFISKDISKDAGARLSTSGYSGHSFEFNGADQTFNGNFTGTSRFYVLKYNNTGIVTMNGPADVSLLLYLTNGRIQTTTTNILRATRTPIGNGLYEVVNGFVEGPISINLRSSDSPNKFLPVGKNNIRKFVYPLDIPSSIGTWIGEYFNTSPGLAGMSPLSMDPPLETISQSEYWRITGPAGVASRIRLTLDGTSDVAAGIGGNLSNLRIVYWDGDKWVVAGGGATVTGTAASGTISTTGTFTFNGAEQFFTIGAVETVEILTATISSVSESICESDTYDLEVTIIGNYPPFEIDYSIGAANYTESNIMDLVHPITLSVPPLALGANTVTITAIRDSDSPVNTGSIIGTTNVTVTVYANPTAFEVSSGGNICGGTTTTIDLSGSEIGFTYELYRNGGLLAGRNLAGTGNPLTFPGIDQAGTYTVEAFNNNNPSCRAVMDDNAVIEFGSAATAQITDLVTATVCENEPVTIEITFTGQPPFTFTLQDDWGNSWIDQVIDFGGEPYVTLFTIPDQYPVWNPADLLPKVYTYTISEIEDSSGCTGGVVLPPGTSVNVYKIPETGPQYHIPNIFGE